MRFRTRLLLILTAAIVASVAVVDLLVLGSTRRAFERLEAQRANALVLQFRNEFDRRRRELVRTVNAIAASEATRQIAIQPDTSAYYDYAAPQAATHDLDMLELVAADGTIVSSAQYAARFGYKENWLTSGEDWKQRGAFLRREELPQGVTLALVAVGTAVGGRPQTLRGGRPRAGPRVPLHAGAARRDAGPALSQPGSAFHAGGTDRRSGSCGRCRGTASFDRTGAVGAPRDFPHRRLGRGCRELPRRAASRVRQQYPGRAADCQLAPRPGGLGELAVAHGLDCGLRGDSARHFVELVGGGARDAPHAPTGGQCRTRRRGRLEYHRGCLLRRRDRHSGARIQSHDRRTGGATRTPGAGRARRRMARTGEAPGARIEESAVSPPDYGGEHDARARPLSRTVRRSLPRRHRYAVGGVGPAKTDRRALQRFRAHAGSRYSAGGVQRPGLGDLEAVRRPTGAGAGSSGHGPGSLQCARCRWTPNR